MGVKRSYRGVNGRMKLIIEKTSFTRALAPKVGGLIKIKNEELKVKN